MKSTLAIVICVLACPSVHAQNLMMTHVYTNGGTDACSVFDRDFVEVRNISTGAVNLSGYKLQWFDCSGAPPLGNVFNPGAVVLAPGDVALLEVRPTTVFGAPPPVAADWTMVVATAANTLPDTCGTLCLAPVTTVFSPCGVPTSGTVEDRIVYGQQPLEPQACVGVGAPAEALAPASRTNNGPPCLPEFILMRVGGDMCNAPTAKDAATQPAFLTPALSNHTFNTFIPGCDDIDFDNDGLYPTTSDINEILTVFGGGPCSTNNCDTIDFDQNCNFPDPGDIYSMLSVFSGGPC